MLEPVSKIQNEPSFNAKNSDKKSQVSEESRILPNTAKTRAKQEFQKTSSAFLDYPVKGLKGDVNSNFYEFLTMGIVPYLAGSATFMLVFNIARKYLNLFQKESAAKIGNKMALGVVLYGLFKNISKNFVTKPVKMATGVDTEMPYENVVYSLPKGAGEAANIEIQYQQRKVYDSKEFFRKDLLNKEYFDKVASKLGLGDDLNDSVTETTPIIQNIVATTNTAKSLSSYCWAAVGVGMAVQDSWMTFFESVSNRNKFVKNSNDGFIKNLGGRLENFGKNIWNISIAGIKSFGKSFVELWHGNENYNGFMRHSGKGLIGLAALMTTILTANSIKRAKNMAKNRNLYTIDSSKESTVI